MKRRPSAEDRAIADWVRGLPEGHHVIEVGPPGCVPVKSEGGMYWRSDDRTVSFIRSPAIGLSVAPARVD